MKVLLKQDIDSLGRMGEVVEVARGYARNYLIPRDMAVAVTRSRLKDIEEQRRVLEVKAAREKERLQAVADRITSRPLVVKARCSASGKLFGSITNRQLAERIEELTGEQLDRHRIIIPERIRTVGPHPVRIRLHPEIELEFEFEVEGEGFVAEEPPAVEETTGAPEQVEPQEEVGVEAAETTAGTEVSPEPAPAATPDVDSGSDSPT